MCKLGVISQERLKIEVKLLWNINVKSYMQRRLVQQRMTLSDLEWPFPSRAISMVAEILVMLCKRDRTPILVREPSTAGCTYKLCAGPKKSLLEVCGTCATAVDANSTLRH